MYDAIIINGYGFNAQAQILDIEQIFYQCNKFLFQPLVTSTC